MTDYEGADAIMDTSNDTALKKKGRGRPRKYAPGQSPLELRKAKDVAEGVVRRRGRPRKHLLTEDQAPEQNGVIKLQKSSTPVTVVSSSPPKQHNNASNVSPLNNTQRYHSTTARREPISNVRMLLNDTPEDTYNHPRYKSHEASKYSTTAGTTNNYDHQRRLDSRGLHNRQHAHGHGHGHSTSHTSSTSSSSFNTRHHPAGSAGYRYQPSQQPYSVERKSSNVSSISSDNDSGFDST